MPHRRNGGEEPAGSPSTEDAARTAEEAALAARLDRLSRSLDAGRKVDGPTAPVAPRGATAGWAHAMRVSSEFIGGIVVGGAIGWAVDWALGISPFGLIVFLMLGFAAGVLNVLRATGNLPEFGRQGGGKGPDKTK